MAKAQRLYLSPSLKAATLQDLLQQLNSARYHCCNTYTFILKARQCRQVTSMQDLSNCKEAPKWPIANQKWQHLVPQFAAELMLVLTWSLSTNLFASNLFISSISPPPPPPLLVRLASLLETPLGLDPPEPSSGLRQKSTLELMKSFIYNHTHND